MVEKAAPINPATSVRNPLAVVAREVRGCTLETCPPPWQWSLMATLRESPIQPLDLILFRGIDAVSHAICFVEAKTVGYGDFSHAGVVVTREVLDLPFLEPGKFYVWESTMSAPAGFWAHFTDKVPDAETKGMRFGVQIRDLELVIPGYSVGGGKVAWCAFRGERPSIEEARKHLLALHEEYGHAPYTADLLDVFAVVFPALRTTRDRFDNAQDRLAHFMNHVLERARSHKRFVDAEHHVFCSEWVGIVYKRLGLAATVDFDPRLAAPVAPLNHPDRFADPVLLEPEHTAAPTS